MWIIRLIIKPLGLWTLDNEFQYQFKKLPSDLKFVVSNIMEGFGEGINSDQVKGKLIKICHEMCEKQRKTKAEGDRNGKETNT